MQEYTFPRLGSDGMPLGAAGKEANATQDVAGNRRRKGAPRAAPRPGGVLPHFQPVDVTHIDAESTTLADCLLYFCDYGERSKREVEVMVKRLGGKVSCRFQPLSLLTRWPTAYSGNLCMLCGC